MRFTYAVRATPPWEWARERPYADDEMLELLLSHGKEYEDELRREVAATAMFMFGPWFRIYSFSRCSPRS